MSDGKPEILNCMLLNEIRAEFDNKHVGISSLVMYSKWQYSLECIWKAFLALYSSLKNIKQVYT